MSKLLIIDDEDHFRQSLSERLMLRGYQNMTLKNGVDAMKTVRAENEIDIVILDRKMPEMGGEQVLKEIKQYRPEVQVIMLTGYGTTESAVEVGKLDAFAYLQKPCELDELIKKIEEAREEKVIAMHKHEIPVIEPGSVLRWLKGTHNSRPGIIILGALLFIAITYMPTPEAMTRLLSEPKTGQLTDNNLGYADYRKMEPGQNIAQYYGHKFGLEKTTVVDGQKVTTPMTVEEAAGKAKVMLAVLVIAALFWAGGAVPIGITSLLVGVFMYFFAVLKPDDIAQAYAKDAVIFIFGVLAFATAISKTGLDKRIGILLLGTSKSVPLFLFLFLPLFSMACSFLSEHALIAFIMPVLLIVYMTSIKAAGTREDLGLAVVLMLSVNFAANLGGPGSPAAGGRNAVMIGILTDYGIPPSFGEWVMYGLPFVPVSAIAIGLYFYIFYKRRSKQNKINFSLIVKDAGKKIGPMTKNEYITAGVLVLLVTLWVTASDKLGMGGPVILALVLLNIFRIIGWKDIAKIQWDVVALYAAASAMGKGLATTGAALFLADSFVDILPEYMKSGEGLAIAASLFTGITTNLMSDGATVSALGPITVPMATISNTNPWMVGFATAFASSFAHMLVIGTPNNAIVYTMAKNPITGAQLINLSDFLKHGAVVLLISFAMLWFWLILGYWGWIGFD